MKRVAVMAAIAAALLTACSSPAPRPAPTERLTRAIASPAALAPTYPAIRSRPHRVQVSASARKRPGPLYGVTADDVTHLSQLVASEQRLPEMPTTRIYFDVREPASYYAAAIRRLRPVSHLMGELLDSSDETRIGIAAYQRRVHSYLTAFGSTIDLWEIGNEVNGNWTGPYRKVSAKLTEAYRAVSSRGKRTALTLYYNVGCGDGRAELDPLAFSRRYVPRPVRDGLGYVLLSYYEDDCHGARPGPARWEAYFRQLHAIYPHALLGFGEIGMNNPAGQQTLTTGRSLIHYYYGLRITLPYYVGGYFWWYYNEDCARPPGRLRAALRSGFRAEESALGRASHAGSTTSR
jgi:hypothetical protein